MCITVVTVVFCFVFFCAVGFPKTLGGVGAADRKARVAGVQAHLGVRVQEEQKVPAVGCPQQGRQDVQGERVDVLRLGVCRCDVFHSCAVGVCRCHSKHAFLRSPSALGRRMDKVMRFLCVVC